MFTRRGDANASRMLPPHQLTELQLEEARTAAAPIRLAVMPAQPHADSAAGSIGAPPPIPAGQATASSTLVHSVIGEDLTIEGQAITIRCRGALEINGNIQAELHSQKLVVGKSGRVEGTIAADNVEVWGHVSGTIKGARVSLHPGAEVEGDILAKTLAVADGASFEGRSRKVTDLDSIAPRLDSVAIAKKKDGPISVPLPQSRDDAATA
jgi:cytoskeletal protein CcmA (bactofilin family)